MKIRIRYFASVREKLGISEEWVTLPENLQTIEDVRLFLIRRGGVWAEVLSAGHLKVACQLQMANPHTKVTEGCEVAFFPPVTGG